MQQGLGRTEMLEVIRTIELNPLDMGDDKGPLRFRIEVLKDLRNASLFFARLCRWESFKMQPWPTESESDGSVEDVLIEDSFWDWKKHPASSAEAALELLLAKLRSQLPTLSPDET
jgi:hypothetical protein